MGAVARPRRSQILLLDVGAEMRAGADRAGNLSHGHLARGGFDARGVAAIFVVPVRDFQAESDRLGVNAVRAADFGRVLEFPRALFKDFAEPRDAFFDQPRRFADQQRLRGVHHVIGSETIVQPARRFGIADGFLHDDGEGDHVVPDFRFDFVDARDVNARPLAQFRARLPCGTIPASASVSVAASSTSSHFWNLFSSLQTRPISERV